MTNFTQGFGDELVKIAVGLGALKTLGRFAVKHPLLTLGTVGTGYATMSAAKEGYKRGRRGGEGPRYLKAKYDPISRRATTSRAAYTNYNPLFKSKPTKKQLKRIHGKYKEEAFKR
jgi:hypothetical protein